MLKPYNLQRDRGGSDAQEERNFPRPPFPASANSQRECRICRRDMVGWGPDLFLAPEVLLRLDHVPWASAGFQNDSGTIIAKCPPPLFFGERGVWLPVRTLYVQESTSSFVLPGHCCVGMLSSSSSLWSQEAPALGLNAHDSCWHKPNGVPAMDSKPAVIGCPKALSAFALAILREVT